MSSSPPRNQREDMGSVNMERDHMTM